MPMCRRTLLGAVPALATAPALAAQPAPPVMSPRVVSLDFGLTETLLALGVAPVGMPGPAYYRQWVVDPILPDGVADVGQRTQPNLELLASLTPDAILTIADHDAILPQLRNIAPVLRLPIYTARQRPWDCSVEAARVLGAWLGRAEAAERLVEDIGQRCADTRARLALRPVRPLLVASFTDPRHLRVYAAGSILQACLDRLGLRNAWSGGTGIWGSANVGLDALAPLEDAALFTIDPQPPDLAAVLDGSPLWRALAFVRARRVFTLPPVLMFGTLPAADRFAALLAPRLTGTALLG